MAKQDVLEQIRRARGALLTAIEGLPDDAMLRPGVIGFWSVKDILAHLTTWESELITALAQLDRPTRVPEIVKIEDIDDWNEEQYRNNVRRGLDAVMEDFNGVHKHLLKAVEALDDKTLDNVRKFPWMEGEPLTYLIMENAIWHEQEHAEDIRKWREQEGL
ncbi:MAG: DinB family protein [Anaerolineae bacterium]|nr:DinB family protein [Anaerolineae bacterium]